MPWCSIAQMLLSCYIVNFVCILFNFVVCPDLRLLKCDWAVSMLNFVCILDVNNHSLFNFQYVGYARTYVNPKLTPAAAEVLQVSFNLIRLIVFLMFFVFCYRLLFFRQLVSLSWCKKKRWYDDFFVQTSSNCLGQSWRTYTIYLDWKRSSGW